MDTKAWYDRDYTRLFLDMHIPDWDERFLSKFDVDEYLDILDTTGCHTFTIFANSHTGLNHWPSNVGRMHKSLDNRDLVGELVNKCHKRGYHTIIYYCTIYVDWFWENYPEARIVDAAGRTLRSRMRTPSQPRRYSTCCPNNPLYREFAQKQLSELASNYDVDGFWIDMIFWPTVCYCQSCRELFARDGGYDIPKVVNWRDPVWVRFQRRRESWLVEFEKMLRETVKAQNSKATVVFQSAAYSLDWLAAPSVELSTYTDWLSADLKETKSRISYLGKLFYNLSAKKPFEQLSTWFYPEISEHIVARTEDHLKCDSFNTLLNSGAQVFIDILDPEGTTNPHNYGVASRVVSEMRDYAPYLGGQFCHDVAVYHSFQSLIDAGEIGMPVIEKGYILEGPMSKHQSLSSHLNCCLNMGTILSNQHIPFTVITKKNIASLNMYQIVVLPNVLMMDEEEIAAFREFVNAGGSLYASKDTSLLDTRGSNREDFGLHEVLGIHYEGESKYNTTFVAPSDEYAADIFPVFSKQYPVTYNGTQNLVSKESRQAEVLAKLTLPYCDPQGSRYSIIHADPPGEATNYPAIVFNHFGRGNSIYCAGAFEMWKHPTQQTVVGNLLKKVAKRPFVYETDAPGCIEIAILDQSTERRFIAMVLNYQEELPNIPVHDVNIRINTERRVDKVLSVPHGEQTQFKKTHKGIEFRIDKIEIFKMFIIEYS